MLALILSVLGVGGIGAAAFLFPPFGLFLGRALKGVLNFLRAIPWQVWLGLAIAGIIVFLVISRGNWKDRAEAAETELSTLCAATREAAANPKLDCKRAAAQIRELGASLKNTTDALKRQNTAVSSWKAEAGRQQAAAAAAAKKAKPRADRALSTAERLKASAARAPANQCEPSEALKEAWQ
jgi:hypothetical protein